MVEDPDDIDTKEKRETTIFGKTKKWNPYCIRHSSITADSDYLPEYALKKKVRWSMNSRQGSRYIKSRMGNDLKEKILENNGIFLDTNKVKKSSVIDCPRCEFVNAIEKKFCTKCSYPLSTQSYEELKQREDEKISILEKQINDLTEAEKNKTDFTKEEKEYLRNIIMMFGRNIVLGS